VDVQDGTPQSHCGSASVPKIFVFVYPEKPNFIHDRA